MKSLLIALLVLIFSSSVSAAKWDPSREQTIQLFKLLAHELNREKVFIEFKRVIDQGVNVSFIDFEGETMLIWLANVKYHRWEADEDQRPIPFSDWDKKLLKLLVDNGADLNQILVSSSRLQYTALHRAVENKNLALAKEMVALGANHLTSLSEHSFNLEQNVLTYTMNFGTYDLETFEYFFNLGGWVPNTRAFCSAGDGAMSNIGSGRGMELRRKKILKILEAAGYDWEKCDVILGLGH